MLASHTIPSEGKAPKLKEGGIMIRFFTHSVFPYLAVAAIASMVTLNLYLAKKEGQTYLLLLLIPAALTWLIYRSK